MVCRYFSQYTYTEPIAMVPTSGTSHLDLGARLYTTEAD